MCSAIDTLASQAFGARNFSRVGAIAQRGVLILGLLCSAQAVLWAFSGPILASLGQDPEVVQLAATYVQVRIPELPAAMLFEVAKRSLQAQGIVNPPAYVTGATIAVHALLAYILTFHTAWGFWGATASGVLTRWAQAVALLGYTWVQRASLRVVTVADLRRVASAEGSDDRASEQRGGAAAYKQVEGGGAEQDEGGVEVVPMRLRSASAAGSRGARNIPLAPLSDVDGESSSDDSDSDSGVEGGGDEGRGILRKPKPVKGGHIKHVAARTDSLSGSDSDEGGEGGGSAGGAPGSDSDAGGGNSSGADTDDEAATVQLVKERGVSTAPRVPLTASEVSSFSQKRLMRLPGETVLGVVWGGWSWKDALSGWGVFISLGVPGAVMATLDWASFEALAVITGLLGVTQLAAHTVLAQIGSLSFLVPYGIAVATSVRVGQAMGRGDAPGALLSARVSWAAGVAWGLVNFLLVVPTATWWPWAFTSDAPVAAMATASAWAVALFSVLDSLQQLNVGILKGIGQQCVGMVVYPLAYLGVGLPLAYALAHPAGLGVAGVWLGETLGAAVAVSSLAALLAFKYNWHRLAEECHAIATVQQA